MRIISLNGSQTIQSPELGTVEAGEDGVFDVGTELGTHLLQFKALYVTEEEHHAAALRTAVAELSDPTRVPEILLQLMERVSLLEKAILPESASETETAPSTPAAAPDSSTPPSGTDEEAALLVAEKRAAAEAKRQATLQAKKAAAELQE